MIVRFIRILGSRYFQATLVLFLILVGGSSYLNSNNNAQVAQKAVATLPNAVPTPPIQTTPVTVVQQSSSQTVPTTYKGPICTTTTIPYDTIQKDDSSLPVGQSHTYPGINGFKSTCTPDSRGFKPIDITSPGMPAEVYVGTWQPAASATVTTQPATTPTSTQAYRNAQAYQAAQSYCNSIGADSSAYQMCMYAYGF